VARSRRQLTAAAVAVALVAATSSDNWGREKGVGVHRATMRCWCSWLRMGRHGVVSSRHGSKFDPAVHGGRALGCAFARCCQGEERAQVRGGVGERVEELGVHVGRPGHVALMVGMWHRHGRHATEHASAVPAFYRTRAG
jgi:hypothetical protein